MVRASMEAESGTLRRGTKRAVFIDEQVAKRFGSDEELEDALRALVAASEHVRRTG
jgi:hypothetical protein